jgi:hypothetical protein
MNCKPGDLAVIVRSVNKENIGLFVEVIEPCGNAFGGVRLTREPGPVWRCKSKGLMTYMGINGSVLQANEGPVPDAVLWPIRPGQTKAKSSVTDQPKSVVA